MIWSPHKYATGQLAPALQQAIKCYLAGVVAGTPQKAKDWIKDTPCLIKIFTTTKVSTA
jgi:hypothetical protein